MAKSEKITKKTVKAKSEPKVTPKKVAGLDLVVYDLKGVKKTPAKLPKDIFAKKVNDKLLALYVRVYLTNQRQGTVSTKTRAEVITSTRKIYKQKGTGRARHGAKSAPIFVGGGVAFGPRPRTFESKLNKKQRRAAFFGALTKAYEKDNIVALTEESLTASSKTKDIAFFLKKLDLSKKKVLFVLPKIEKSKLVLASRNIPTVELTDAASLNTYSVLTTQKIVFVKSALAALEKHFLAYEN